MIAERQQLWLLGHRSHGSGLLGRFSNQSDSEVDSEVSYKLFEVVLTGSFDRQMPAYTYSMASSPTRMQSSLQHANPSKQEEYLAGVTFLLLSSLLLRKPRQKQPASVLALVS